jgi:outer membrane protein
MRKYYIVFFFAAFIVGVCASYAGEKPPEHSGKNSPDARLITLSEGITMVLRDSRIIKIAFADKDAAYEESLLARSALLPKVDASITQTYLTHKPAAKFGDQRSPTAETQSLAYGVAVYQTLFDFGRSFSNYKASRALLDANETNIELVRRVSVLEFIVSYFNVLEAEKMIEVAATEVEALTAYLSDIEHLYEEGVVIKNDLLPAKVRLADARQKLIAARNARALAATKLNTLLTLSLREKIQVKDITMGIPQVPVDIDATWEITHDKRPEIRIVDDQIKASGLSAYAKSTNRLPTVFTESGYSYTQNKYQVHQDNVFVNLGAKLNIFDGWASKADTLKERARGKSLLEQKNELLDDIRFEVEGSYLGVHDALERVRVAADTVAQAQENVRVNRIKYSEGSGTTTEVLEAITLATNAQTNYYQADYQLKRDYAKLLYSMGEDFIAVYETMAGQNDGHTVK